MASRTPSPKRSWRGEKEGANPDNPRYLQIRARTDAKKLWPTARDLVFFMGMVTPPHQATVHALLKGQYDLARSLGRDRFIRELRDYADVVVDREFVVRVLGGRPARTSRTTPGSIPSSRTCNTDVRLKTNPGIERVSCDFGRDFPALPSSSSPSSPKLLRVLLWQMCRPSLVLRVPCPRFNLRHRRLVLRPCLVWRRR